MAAGKTAVSFDSIIQADRQRRKNEALANEIFGRGRKLNSTNIENRKFNNKSSFASRVGVTKLSQRSSSSTPNTKSNIEAALGHDLHLPRGNQVSWPSRQQSHSARKVKHERLFEAAADSSAPITSSSRDTTADLDGEINIRGIAGPCVVVATNFAPGTTAADIESAMLPSAGEMQSCKIVAYSPSLTAELAFADRANAENVIAAFNNKKADGRVLQVYMKRARSNPPTDSPTPKAVIGSRAPRADLIRSDLPPSELPHLESLRSESMRPEPITPDPGRSGSYDYQRERSDMNRRRAEPEIQDGSYGFESGNVRMDVDVDNHRDSWRNGEGSTNVIRARDDRHLYSDDLYPRHRGRVFR